MQPAMDNDGIGLLQRGGYARRQAQHAAAEVSHVQQAASAVVSVGTRIQGNISDAIDLHLVGKWFRLVQKMMESCDEYRCLMA